LSRLYKLNVKVLIISGNHDSKDRLSFGNELFVDNGVYIEGVFSGILRKEMFEDKFGKLNFYMLPFVKPVEVKKFYPEENIQTYNDAVKCIIENTDINISERNIIMVHQFITGSGIEIERSDSETISLGGIDNIDVSLFDDFDYVAMGHIHGAQKLIRDTVRYAGSPLKYSFSEINQKKSVCIIEFNEKGNIGIELVSLNPIRDMRVIKGPLDKLLDKEVYSKDNTLDYLSVILTDEDYKINAISKLRRVYPNVLKLEYQNKKTALLVNDGNNVGKIKGRSPIELFEDFYYKQNGIELDSERRKLVDLVIKEVSDETN